MSPPRISIIVPVLDEGGGLEAFLAQFATWREAGDELIVEAKMPPKDIAYVRVGQLASVKFDAYDASIYGSAQGKVTYISADTLAEQTPRGEEVYYRVHIEVDTSQMKPHLKNEKIEIQPGMTAMAEIQTGKNTVWKYLTKPINKSMSEAMTER